MVQDPFHYLRMKELNTDHEYLTICYKCTCLIIQSIEILRITGTDLGFAKGRGYF